MVGQFRYKATRSAAWIDRASFFSVRAPLKLRPSLAAEFLSVEVAANKGRRLEGSATSISGRSQTSRVRQPSDRRAGTFESPGSRWTLESLVGCPTACRAGLSSAVGQPASLAKRSLLAQAQSQQWPPLSRSRVESSRAGLRTAGRPTGEQAS